jgi:LytS/YehU family sensor histidine kinase
MNPDEPQPDEPENLDADSAESIRKSPRNHWFLWGGLLFGPVMGLPIGSLFKNSMDGWIVTPWLAGTVIAGGVAAWGWSGVAGKTQSRILWTILMMHLTIPVSLIAAGSSMCCGAMRSR